MRYAIFSDIHNDPDALSQVLADAAASKVDAHLCLGDVGIDSCVDLVRNVGAECVFGNWELSGWRHLSQANQQWALHLPPMRKYDQFWISHAAPTWPQKMTNLQAFLKHRHGFPLGRVFPYYTDLSDSLWKAFSELMSANISVLFHGHTHRQVVWALSAENEVSRHGPTSLQIEPGQTYIVGVGSVGQPVDSLLPSYVIFDAAQGQVEFRRVEQ